MSHFPTGVTVVTGAPEGRPAGMTIGSFFSVSLDPPLVGLCAGKGSTSWPLIEPAGCFTVNFLGADQANLSDHFASSAADKFDGIGYRAGITGSPILDGAVAHIDCETDRIVDAGDHHIVIGRVVELGVDRDDGADGEPLLFFRRTYGTFAARS
ncbi:MAG: flavin reductase [Acidimicrobiia bacterium]|nr:flavin reductase [Acidimicrobiia bacterium]